MAGATVEITSKASDTLASLVARIDNPAPLYQRIIELLTRSHRARFKAQVSPDGQAWAALSPRYQARKRRNKNKILTLRGYLSGTLRGQYDADGVEFGTDREYGAIHQFGGEIKRPPSQREVFFRMDRAGNIGNRFVKAGRSNFAQMTSVPEHSIKIPARPWLGTTAEDERRIMEITAEYLSP